MKIRNFLFSLLFLIGFICPSYVHAQGQIFTKAEANILFGPVLSSTPISKATLKDMVAKSPKKVLFAIKSGKVLFATPQRTAFNTLDATEVSTVEIFRVVDSNTLSQFLNSSADDTVYFEQRNGGVNSLTSGDTTLEKVGTCPPVCD